jgi:ankyrin repeat protein
VCARDNRGRTALHRWTARGLLNELPSLFPLIAAGADLDAVDDGGNTCRQLLARRQLTIDPEKVEAARRDIAKARIDFVRYRALEVCIGLQSLRLDALQVCEILQFACGPSAPLIPFHIWWTIATTVKHFVRAIVASNGATPLHAAAGQTDVRVFHMLVNVCGIDVETRNDDGSASIHFGAVFENAVALRWLIEAGADVNVADNDGATPLHRANDFDCAVLLLAAGANVCARDCHGRTALHDFVANEVSELTVHALLAAGADLDAVDNDGETARHMLARRGWAIDPDNVEASRREIAKARIDFVRDRARQVCIGLQSLRIDALQMCEVLQFACGAIAPLIPFHIWWKIATTVKHFRTK